jgi:RNA polymerase sigma-70 factor (ECF subfamily)
MPPDSPPAADWPALVARVLAGDQQAASGIVESLYMHVLRIVRSHLPRAVDEEDISQEVFMKVFGRLETWRGDQPFPHWVARITVNTCYDRLRRQKSRPEVRFADLNEEEAAFLENTFTGSDGSETAPSDSDGSEIVEKLLATLNATEQTVLRLLDMEQKSVQEITALTGWGASKVKVTAMRARRKLNDTLKRLESSRPQ